MSIDDLDVHGLVTLTERWTPKGLTVSPESEALLRSIRHQVAYVLNILIDAEQYFPIILNPSRTLADDLDRILEMVGIDSSNRTVESQKARRLAILASLMRSWRGAFVSHRSVSTALTGGPAILIPYLKERVVVDLSSMNVVLNNEKSSTTIFVLGQGPSGQEYEQGELEYFLIRLALPATDYARIVPCFALTAWRDGYSGWAYDGIEPDLIGSPHNGEYEAVEIGPDVSADTSQYLRTSTAKYPTINLEAEWITVWFKTSGVQLGEYWEVYAYASEDGPDGASAEAYIARVNTRSGLTTLHRKYAGAVGAALASMMFDISDSLVGEYHRLDFSVIQDSFKARLRLTIDGNSGPWVDDIVHFDEDRPKGTYAFVGHNSGLTEGRLRVAAITAQARQVGGAVLPIPPFLPTNLPSCLSWWDCFGGEEITLGGVGGIQVVELADKGPANVPLTAVSAPTDGINVGTWEINGDVVPLPGPMAALSPRRVLEGATSFTAGDMTIVAMIPLGSVSADSHYWTYSHGTIPVVRIGLTCSVTPAGRIRLVFGTGIGPSEVTTANLVFDGGNGPAAHSIVIATMDAGTGAITLDVWYDLDTGSGVQHPSQVTATGYTGTPVQYASFGGRRNVTDTWSGVDARMHAVVTFDEVLSGPDQLLMLNWAKERLGW